MTFGSTSTQLRNTINSVSHDFYCVGRIELKQVTMEKKKRTRKKDEENLALIIRILYTLAYTVFYRIQYKVEMQRVENYNVTARYLAVISSSIDSMRLIRTHFDF